ncbi:hypothetical protein B9Z55_024466 [Caenorhabditis nigoni]|uniref:Carbonic anhydrase n=2 Tax=Caenorhabditis nigoni TaxID=1611254 RepID=A0A2G5SUN1_9PELO|nr:hypothetical protein B9Z55_024466 [Caenorhabditis nigoni]
MKQTQEKFVMNRIIRGVIKYNQNIKSGLVKQFEHVSDHPNPTAVMFTCMDSRMLPTRFTQSAVGDMFVVRNAGNMIPAAPNYGSYSEVSINTEPAALELAVKRGKIRHVVVCGHSDCKAMNTLYQLHQCPTKFDVSSPMDQWLRRNGFESMKKLNERLHIGPKTMKFESEVAPSQSFEAIIDPLEKWSAEDKLSQINVLQQIMNISTHEFLKDFLEAGNLHLHGAWFNIYDGEVFLFSKDRKRFIVIDEKTVPSLSAELERRCPLPEDKAGDVVIQNLH